MVMGVMSLSFVIPIITDKVIKTFGRFQCSACCNKEISPAGDALLICRMLFGSAIFIFAEVEKIIVIYKEDAWMCF